MDEIFGWAVLMVGFAVVCGLVHFLAPGGVLLGAPGWAWGLASLLAGIASLVGNRSSS